MLHALHAGDWGKRKYTVGTVPGIGFLPTKRKYIVLAALIQTRMIRWYKETKKRLD